MQNRRFIILVALLIAGHACMGYARPASSANSSSLLLSSNSSAAHSSRAVSTQNTTTSTSSSVSTISTASATSSATAELVESINELTASVKSLTSELKKSNSMLDQRMDALERIVNSSITAAASSSSSGSVQRHRRGGTEVSSSVLIYTFADIEVPQGGGPSPCQVAVNNSRGFNAKSISYVIHVFHIFTLNMTHRYYYKEKDPWGDLIPADNSTIARFKAGLASCFKAGIDAGFTTLHIVAHTNVIMHEVHGKSIWRNVVRCNPIARYGPENGTAVSYADVVLLPAAEALNSVANRATIVEFTLTGEMGLSTWSYARHYTKLMQQIKDIITQAGHVGTGVSFNYNKICGCVEPEERDPLLYNSTYLERFARFRAAAGFQQVDVEGMKELLDKSDLIGLSAYAPLPAELTLASMETSIQTAAFELQPFGIDLKHLIFGKGKLLMYTEQGLGASEGRMVAPDLEWLRSRPYAGSGPAYSHSVDPWKVPEFREYRRRLYQLLTTWAAGGGGPQYRVDGIFVWNSGTWDVHGVHPRVLNKDGTYADCIIQSYIKQANLEVNGPFNSGFPMPPCEVPKQLAPAAPPTAKPPSPKPSNPGPGSSNTSTAARAGNATTTAVNAAAGAAGSSKTTMQKPAANATATTASASQQQQQQPPHGQAGNITAQQPPVTIQPAPSAVPQQPLQVGNKTATAQVPPAAARPAGSTSAAHEQLAAVNSNATAQLTVPRSAQPAANAAPQAPHLANATVPAAAKPASHHAANNSAVHHQQKSSSSSVQQPAPASHPAANGVTKQPLQQSNKTAVLQQPATHPAAPVSGTAANQQPATVVHNDTSVVKPAAATPAAGKAASDTPAAPPAQVINSSTTQQVLPPAPAHAAASGTAVAGAARQQAHVGTNTLAQKPTNPAAGAAQQQQQPAQPVQVVRNSTQVREPARPEGTGSSAAQQQPASQ